MVAHAKPQQRKKEESERLRGERDQIKYGYHLYMKLREFMQLGFKNSDEKLVALLRNMVKFQGVHMSCSH